MPIYEYRCQECHSRISVWFRSFAETETKTPVCAECGSESLTRIASSVAVLRPGAGGAPREGTPPSTGAASQEDPRSLARSLREAARGRDMGSDFKEVAARLEKGESPASIEASLRKRSGQKPGIH